MLVFAWVFNLNPELWSKINFVEKRIKPATVATEINGKNQKNLVCYTVRTVSKIHLQ